MTAPTLTKLKVKLFTDGADIARSWKWRSNHGSRVHHQSFAAREAV